MYVSISRTASLTGSSTLGAAAKDNLADVLTSAAAFLGTLASQFIHPLADPIAGLLVAIWIFRSALGVWRENLRYLSGGGASTELQLEIASAARVVEGVLRVHQVITEHVGPDLIADLHINVDGALSLLRPTRSRTRCVSASSPSMASIAPMSTLSPARTSRRYRVSRMNRPNRKIAAFGIDKVRYNAADDTVRRRKSHAIRKRVHREQLVSPARHSRPGRHLGVLTPATTRRSRDARRHPRPGGRGMAGFLAYHDADQLGPSRPSGRPGRRLPHCRRGPICDRAHPVPLCIAGSPKPLRGGVM